MRWILSFVLFFITFSIGYGVNADTITFKTPKGDFSGPWIGSDHSVTVARDYLLIFGNQTLVTSEGFTNRFFYGIFKKDTDFLFSDSSNRKAILRYKDSGVENTPALVHYDLGGTVGQIVYSTDTNGSKDRSMRYGLSSGEIVSVSFASILQYVEGSNYRMVYNVKLYSDGAGFSEKDLNELEVFSSGGYGFDDYQLDYNKMIELGLNTPRKETSTPTFDFLGDFGGSLKKLLFDSDGISSRLLELSRVFSQFDIRKPLFTSDSGPSGYSIGTDGGLARATHFFGWGELSRSMIWRFQEWVLTGIQALYFYRKIQTLGASAGSVYSGVSYIVKG